MPVFHPFNASAIVPNHWTLTPRNADRPEQAENCQRYFVGNLNCRREGES